MYRNGMILQSGEPPKRINSTPTAANSATAASSLQTFGTWPSGDPGRELLIGVQWSCYRGQKNWQKWSIFFGANQTWYQMLLVILRDFPFVNNALFWGWCHINIMTPGYLEAYTYGTSSCIGMTTLESVCLFLIFFWSGFILHRGWTNTITYFTY